MAPRNSSNEQAPFIVSRDNQMLKIQIDYTDTIGKRRSIMQEVPVDIAGSNLTRNGTRYSANGNNVRQTTSTQTIYQQWWFWLIIAAIGYALWKGYKLYKNRKEESEIKNHNETKDKKR
jgi:hypothetical protein